jgi:hypothetical protein
MVMNGRGQFFLLAAVVISVVVISFGATSNRAMVEREPETFYDFSYEVNREVGAVIDYEIYTNFDPDADLNTFVELLAEDIRDGSPDLNFMFIFGNDVDMTLRNYGSSDAYAEGEVIPGAGASVFSRICIGGSCRSVEGVISNFDSGAGYRYLTEEDMAGSDSIDVTVSGYDLSFPISRHRQVIFIMQKEVGDENFVAVG